MRNGWLTRKGAESSGPTNSFQNLTSNFRVKEIRRGNLPEKIGGEKCRKRKTRSRCKEERQTGRSFVEVVERRVGENDYNDHYKFRWKEE